MVVPGGKHVALETAREVPAGLDSPGPLSAELIGPAHERQVLFRGRGPVPDRRPVPEVVASDCGPCYGARQVAFRSRVERGGAPLRLVSAL
jgi:hypothetical protein